jgi:tRNA 2-thiouridine synthesizing protein E
MRSQVPIIEIEGRKLDIDQEGFLENPEAWDETVAEGLARADGIEHLTEKHWAVVRCIRQYYLERDMAPMIRLLCQSTGLRLKEIYELFPLGPAKGACKIAGLPKPDGCV